MTIKQLKELLTKATEEGIDENEQVYINTYGGNETSEIIIAKSDDGETLVYISDAEVDELIESLAEDDYTVKELWR